MSLPSSRFLTSLLPAALLLASVLALATFIHGSIGGGGGVFLGIIAAASFGLGTLLLYWTTADWLDLRLIKKHLINRTETPQDGHVIAASGVIHVDGTPLTSPITQQACSAYTYQISETKTKRTHSGSTRRFLAQGFHMLPSTLIAPETPNIRLSLRALPSVEDDLRIADHDKWSTETRNLLARLCGIAPAKLQHEREDALLQARIQINGTVHNDFCLISEVGDRTVFTVTEEVVPAGVPVCVIGTYEHLTQILTGIKSRFGPNMIVYQGDAEEVYSRISKDVKMYYKTAAIMIGLALAIGVYALLV